jgi:hypothetical protein
VCFIWHNQGVEKENAASKANGAHKTKKKKDILSQVEDAAVMADIHKVYHLSFASAGIIFTHHLLSFLSFS